MAFKGSVSFLAAGQVVVNLPMMTDLGGGSGFSQCYHSHVQVTPASTAVSAVITFDNRPGVNYNTVGLSDVWAIPTGARTMVITPTGGTATAELGSA